MIQQQDITRLFEELSIGKKNVVRLNENMYTVKENIEDNWLYYSFFGFQQLRKLLDEEHKVPKSFATIGTGNGVDALGAAIIFETIDDLFITDIDPRVLEMSERNIIENLASHDGYPNVYTLAGSLCEPLTREKIVVDIIYGNLPNIPSEEDISIGIKKASLYKNIPKTNQVKKEFKDYLLELQALFLRSAWSSLKYEGSILPIIGGRVPYKLFRELFNEEGYEFNELCSGFKLQTEPEDVLPGYAKAENESGVTFDFYLYKESKKFLNSIGLENPTSRLNGEELKDQIKNFKVSATDAIQLYKQGVDIGNTCHLFRGTKIKTK